MKQGLLRIHRWASLAAAAFWLVQALTGILLVFHWEIDDATISAPHRPLDLIAMEASLDRLAPPGSGASVSSIWVSAGAADRFDVSLDRADASYSIRVDGAGNVLRTRKDGERIADGGLIETLVLIHHNLLGGDTGSWIVGASGLLLLSNLVLGLILAWPRRGAWRRTLFPRRQRGVAASRYAWHRAIGLWAVIPAMISVSAGILLNFESGTARLLGAEPYEAPAQPAGTAADVGFARAASAALAAFPDARFSGVYFPTEDEPFYTFRVLLPGEPRRAYGTSRVFVGASDGRVIASFDAREMPPARRFVDSLFAVHTGEIGGTVGRLAIVAIGTWLATMILLGVGLWWARRRRSPAAR